MSTIKEHKKAGILGWLVFVLAMSGFAMRADASVVFTAGFDDGVPAEFSGVVTLEPVQGYEGLGTGGDVFAGDFLWNSSGSLGVPATATVLTLTELPPHSSVTIEFLLAIVDSWDGISDLGGAIDPDYFNVTVDGSLVFRESFDNFVPDDGTYSPPAGGELTSGTNLAFTTFYNDAAFDLGLEDALSGIPHSADTLVVAWFADGGGWQGSSGSVINPDESWAIDNVVVRIDEGSVSVPHQPVVSRDPVENLVSYPNPFNPRTTISFDLGQRSTVSLRVFDATGRVVRTLLEQRGLTEGEHEITWDGCSREGRALPSGTYIYRLESNGQVALGRMTLVR